MSEIVLYLCKNICCCFQTYLDDNTKKSNTPLMLSVAMALRMIGPIIGFLIGML